MVYTVIANDRSYDLPAKTIGVMEKLDEALTVDAKPLTIKQKYQRLFEIARGIVGPQIKEILGGDKLADIDVGELELLILKIQDAYNEPLAEYRAEKLESGLDSIPAEKIKAITDAASAMVDAEKLRATK